MLERLKSETVAIDSIGFDANNVRLHNQENVKAVVKSLERFGQQKPIVVDQNNIVRAGNCTLQAAKKLGWSDIAIVRSSLTDEEMKAYAIADNRTAEIAEWDIEGLEQQLLSLDADLRDIAYADYEFPLEDSEPNEKDDEIPETESNEFGVKVGDVWKLGRHRLMCGDSTNVENVKVLMDGNKVDMVFTDPPYGIGFKYNTYDDTEDKWYDLINAIVPMVKKISPFVVIPSCRITALKWWYENHNPDWIMAWYKGSPGHVSKVGFNDWEPHLVFGKPKKQIHDFWQTKCGFDVEGHPCPKPVEYSQWIIERAVLNGDIVMDLFLGSGSTLIACEKTDRVCFGMELDPVYCSVIIKRWQDYTGEVAECLKT